jgi:hypothetical protein
LVIEAFARGHGHPILCRSDGSENRAASALTMVTACR